MIWENANDSVVNTTELFTGEKMFTPFDNVVTEQGPEIPWFGVPHAACLWSFLMFFYVFLFVFIIKIYLKEINKKCYLPSMRFPLLLLMTCLCEVPASFLFFRHCQDGSRTTSTIMGNKNKQWLQTLWILSYTFPKKVSICLIYLISVQTIIWNYPCFFFSWPRDKKLNT